jgi:hypothetical protein
VLTRPVQVLDRLLKNAHKNREKRKAWDMWLTRYPNMTKETFIEFDDFYKTLTTPIPLNITNETVQDTFNRLKNSLRKDEDNARTSNQV